MAPAEALISDIQAAVYDRQLRVWGHEVQQRCGSDCADCSNFAMQTWPCAVYSSFTATLLRRLTAAKLLIIGGDGLAAEVRG
jgi:hypothetical protein